ncbi:hypothetical protein BDF19DRAFT_411930 [Syncephalis fuscata]|nr:hypothetical protein BDF19DRAFT_411930 [Syncephalis fuscata]
MSLSTIMPIAASNSNTGNSNNTELMLKITNEGPFYPGDSINGQVVICLPYQCLHGELTVRLFGILDTQAGGHLNVDIKEFHTQEIKLWFNSENQPEGSHNNNTSRNNRGYPIRGPLPSGNRAFSFSFTLPDGIYALPSSFDAPQNQLRYTVRSELKGVFRSASTESKIGQLYSQFMPGTIVRRAERTVSVCNHVDADQPQLCRPVHQVGQLARAGWISKLTRVAASVGNGLRSKKSPAMGGIASPLSPSSPAISASPSPVSGMETSNMPRLRLTMPRTGYCAGEWVNMTIGMDCANDSVLPTIELSTPSLASPPSLTSISSASSVSDTVSIEEDPSNEYNPTIVRHRSNSLFDNASFNSSLSRQPSDRRRRATLSEVAPNNSNFLQVPLQSNGHMDHISLASSGMTRTFVPNSGDKLAIDILLRREITCTANNSREVERAAIAVGTHQFSDAKGGAIELRLPSSVIPTVDDSAVGVFISYHLKVTARFTTRRKSSSYGSSLLLGNGLQTHICVLRVPITVGNCRLSQQFDALPLYQDACNLPPAYESLLPFANITRELSATTMNAAPVVDVVPATPGIVTNTTIPATTMTAINAEASSEHTIYQLELPRFSASSFAASYSQLSCPSSFPDSSFAVSPLSDDATTVFDEPSPSFAAGNWWKQHPSGTHSMPTTPTQHTEPISLLTISPSVFAAALVRHERAYASAPCSPLVAEFARYKSPTSSTPEFQLPMLDVEGLPKAYDSPATINGWV